MVIIASDIALAEDESASERAERERAYSPSSCIGGNYQPFMAAYRQQSEQARTDVQALGGRWLRCPYGGAPSQAIELALPRDATPEQPVPTLVFIHGGYWQALSAQDSLFAASACIRRGFGFAAVDYTLAPANSVRGIVRECRAAFRCLSTRSAGWGIDGSRLVLAGSSAGAHLAAMLCAGRAQPRPAGAVLVSGIYELEPLIGTSINDALGLDTAEARKLSPARLSKRGFPPSVVCWGEIETDAFKAQGRDFAVAVQRADVECLCFEVPARNHFDVILDLMDSETLLGAATLSLLTSAA